MTVLSRSHRWWLISLAAAGLAVAGVICYSFRHSPTYKLPYHDSFADGKAGEWKAFGGTWEVADGAMRNDSDERGAKLITGSPYWHNYSIEADVSLLGADGDAGLVLRSSDEEQGVDSYSGYYAGIRSLDNSLVLGRANHGWMEDVLKLSPAKPRGPLVYHLKLLAYDCQIVAMAKGSSRNAPVTVSVTDKECIHSGRAGLRSYASGGVWRNVVIRSSSRQELMEMLDQGQQNNSASAKPLFDRDHEILGFNSPGPQRDLDKFHSSLNTQPISSLRLVSAAKPSTATVRGNVILISPVLFVQDTTGGVSVPNPAASPLLKVGDQVEITGSVKAGDFSSTLEHAMIRVLWEGTPVPPVTVTASQAATGDFDATFIEVEGRLREKQYGPNNTLMLDLDDGSQSFRAIMSQRRGDARFRGLKGGSLLRLRGVSVVDPAFTRNLTPFILLLRSTDDIDVLAGPPWWSAGHLAAIAIGFLLLALVVNFLYHRIENWRLRAVLEERERLAHEMHDTLAQSFAGIGFQLEAIRSGVPEAFPVTHQQLNLASDLVRHSHEEARRSIATLRPDTHGPSDLLGALDLCARRMVEGGSVEVMAASSGEMVSIPLRITDTLYRIGQEAIANSVRHANATRIEITIEFTAGVVRLSIADNGIGFVQGGNLSGFGVRGMRKRAASISAIVQIVSSQQSGTLVQTTAPLPAKVTFAGWPKLLWLYLRRNTFHAEPIGQPNPHSHHR
jgi:signal transduction histidine kinase